MSKSRYAKTKAVKRRYMGKRSVWEGVLGGEIPVDMKIIYTGKSKAKEEVKEFKCRVFARWAKMRDVIC